MGDEQSYVLEESVSEKGAWLGKEEMPTLSSSPSWSISSCFVKGAWMSVSGSSVDEAIVAGVYVLLEKGKEIESIVPARHEI